MTSTRSRMAAYGRALDGLLDTVVLDLTAADLSGLEPRVVPALHALWSADTVWPTEAVKAAARARSRQIRPGVHEF